MIEVKQSTDLHHKFVEEIGIVLKDIIERTKGCRMHDSEISILKTKLAGVGQPAHFDSKDARIDKLVVRGKSGGPAHILGAWNAIIPIEGSTRVTVHETALKYINDYAASLDEAGLGANGDLVCLASAMDNFKPKEEDFEFNSVTINVGQAFVFFTKVPHYGDALNCWKNRRVHISIPVKGGNACDSNVYLFDNSGVITASHFQVTKIILLKNNKKLIILCTIYLFLCISL
jgi:hypothetical protein